MTPNRFPGRSLALVATIGLASCTAPPPGVYLGGKHSGEAFNLGANAAHESCSVQRGGTDAQIYCGTYVEPAGRVVTPETTGDPAAFLTSSAWRSVFDGRFLCGPVAQTTVTVFDSTAATLSCKRRQGGWPHVVLAARIGGTLYVADGVRPVELILPQAIGVLSGKLPATPAKAANEGGLATQRQAAQAINIEGAGAIAEVERQMGRGAQENRRGNYAAAETAYRTAVSLQERIVGANNAALAVPLARQALQVSNQGRFPEADRLYARAERLAALPDQIDPVARPLVAHLKALNEINRNKPAEALVLLDQAERSFAAIVPADALVPRSRSATGARSAVEMMAQAAADSSLVADQSSSDALNGLIESRRYRAIALARLGRLPEAEAALASARDLYAGRDPRLMARYYRTVGMTGEDARRSLSQLGLAVDTFARAQPASMPLAETELLQAARYGEKGDYASALSDCRQAVRTLQGLKTGVTPALLTACLHALSLDAEKGDQKVLAEMFALSQLAQGSITSRQIAMAAARLTEGARDPKVAEAIRQYDAATDRLDGVVSPARRFGGGQGKCIRGRGAGSGDQEGAGSPARRRPGPSGGRTWVCRPGAGLGVRSRRAGAAAALGSTGRDRPRRQGGLDPAAAQGSRQRRPDRRRRTPDRRAGQALPRQHGTVARQQARTVRHRSGARAVRRCPAAGCRRAGRGFGADGGPVRQPAVGAVRRAADGAGCRRAGAGPGAVPDPRHGGLARAFGRQLRQPAAGREDHPGDTAVVRHGRLQATHAAPGDRDLPGRDLRRERPCAGQPAAAAGCPARAGGRPPSCSVPVPTTNCSVRPSPRRRCSRRR